MVRRPSASRASAPDHRVRQHLDPERQRPMDQRRAAAGLRIAAASARRRLLEKLAARARPFVDQQHRGARGARRGRRLEAGRSGPDHEDVDAPLRDGLRNPGQIGEADACRDPIGLRLDHHAVAHLGQAGPRAGPPVRDDEALLAGAHAAEQAARRAIASGALRRPARRQQRRRDRLARHGPDEVAAEAHV